MTSRGRRVRERPPQRVHERRGGDRLGDGERVGVLLPEPLPFSFVADGGVWPRPFDDTIAMR